MADNYGFKTTSLTLVEKLSRGEDWERFCDQYYEPIRMKVRAINKSYRGSSLNDADEADAVSHVFEKLKAIFRRTTYDPNRGHLRHFLGRIIGNATTDYYKQREKELKELTLDAPNDDGQCCEVSVDTPFEADDNDWVRILQETAIRRALTEHPWKPETKTIIKVLCAEAMKEPRDQRSSEELAASLSISASNLRKIRERFYKEVRKRFEQYRANDPDFFAEYAKMHNIPFDRDLW